MRNPWQLSVWGVRGSAPTPGPEYLHYGGNTTCFSLTHPAGRLILDAGTGLASLEETLPNRGPFHIVLSHPHLDHVQGLFPFAPLQIPQTEVHFYGPLGLRETLRRIIAPPLWPVGLADSKAEVTFHELTPGIPYPLAKDLTVTAMESSHPGGGFLYRMEGGGRVVVYALDCELTPELAPRLTAFARNADVLVWDAAYAPGDEHPGWGHSTWEQGLAIGEAAGAKTVLMTHYDRSYTDEFLQRQEARALRTSPLCRFAREGMVIEL